MTRLTRAFDGAAAGYAAARAGNGLLALARRRALARLTAGLPRGARILDAGCGPGLDSARLAARGFRVTALDASPAMLREAARRLAPWIRRGRARVIRAAFTRAARPGGTLHGRFEAALFFRCANFAPTLDPVARLCAAALVPGGRAVVTTAGRWAWREIVAGLVRLQPGAAFRRVARRGVPLVFAGRRVTAWAPPLGEALGAFRRRGLAIERVEPLGLLLPPPHAWRRGRRIGGLRRALDRAEARLAWPAGARFADHALVIVRRP